MPRVLICQGVVYRRPGNYFDLLQEAGLEIVYPEPGGGVLSEEELLANLDGIDATLSSMERYTAEVFDRFPKLRLISRCGVGYDNVDLAEANRRGIAIGITPDCNHEAVAEHTLALLLGAAKRMIANHHLVSSGGFRRQPTLPLRGKTLGLVGFGRIAREVARRATAFGMQVIAARSSPQGIGQIVDGCPIVSLEELWRRSDYLSLHAPLTAESEGLVDRSVLAQMKPGVVLVNTARGALVDELALAEALTDGRVAAAAIDVYAEEPPAGSPLLAAPNVLFSPHVAGADQQSFDLMVTTAARTIVDLFAGRWPDARLANGEAVRRAWAAVERGE